MEVYCLNSNCKNYKVVSDDWPNSLYAKDGTTPLGLQKYKCKSCNQIIIVKSYNLHGKQPDPKINIQILRLILAGKSINDICKISDISPTAFYNKAEYIRTLLVDYEKLKIADKLKGKTIISELIRDKYIITEYEKGSLYLTGLRNCEDLSKCCLENLSPSVSDTIKSLNKLAMFKSSRHRCNAITANQILEIFRICHNFSKLSNQAQDPPAVRLDSVENSISLQELLSLEL